MLETDPEIFHSPGLSAPGRNSDHTGESWAPSYDSAQKKLARDIAKSILEMRENAKKLGLYPIMIPLEFAYYEAFSIGNRVDIPPEELARLNFLAREGRKAAIENVATHCPANTD